MKRYHPIVFLIAVLLTPTQAHAQQRFVDLWLTPDQQGQLKFNDGEFAQAAKRYSDPMHRGVAHFRAGEFEAAAAAFGQMNSPETAFNRGNALVMLGQYEPAIASYDRALQAQPGWAAAAENKRTAEVRLERLAPPEDDAGGTGGKLGADDIVLDERGERGSENQVVEGEQANSDEEIRALWLRRVQTRPADFLRAKFAFQLARQRAEEKQ